MHTSPSGLTIGTHYTQSEIEEMFDTRFGYQVSGIHSRRPSDDERYVLLFADGNGPYSGSVTRGRFEYVGERLEGKQSEKSTGDSALVDAINEDFPIYFFYQHSDVDGWEYHGLVNVLDWEWQQREGQRVLVFTMEHRAQERGATWVDAVRTELERYRAETGSETVTLGEIYDFAEASLAAQFPENNTVRAKLRQQLQVLRDRGDVEFLDGAGEYRICVGGDAVVDDGDVEGEIEQLDQRVGSPPRLTEETEEFAKQKRRVRNSDFARRVKTNYDYTCVVCGKSRETPGGNPEVEAAHIYPRAENGADDVRNGLALCRLHHWAFDTGWLAITDSYEITVKDVPEREGYYEFKQLEGDVLVFPEDIDVLPDQLFLEAHRNMHDFS